MENFKENDINNDIVINQRIRQLLNESKTIAVQQYVSFLVIASILIVILIIASIDSKTLATSDLGIVGIILTFYMNYFIKSIDKRRELHKKIYEMGKEIYFENIMDKDNLKFFEKNILKKHKQKIRFDSLLDDRINNDLVKKLGLEKNVDKLSVDKGVQECYSLKDEIKPKMTKNKSFFWLIIVFVIIYIILMNILNYLKVFERFLMNLFTLVFQTLISVLEMIINIRIDVFIISMIIGIAVAMLYYYKYRFNNNKMIERFINIFSKIENKIDKSKHEELYKFYNKLQKK